MKLALIKIKNGEKDFKEYVDGCKYLEWCGMYKGSDITISGAKKVSLKQAHKSTLKNIIDGINN
jgi:hypothetical protein